MRQYYISVRRRGARAQTRLSQTVNATLREEFGKRTVHEVVSDERDEIMKMVREQASTQDAKRIGVADHRRAPEARRPAAGGERVGVPAHGGGAASVANQLRSEGSAEAEKIRAEADKEREVIIADAYNDAQRIKGEGDAKAAAVYAQAFGQNAEFYAFYRSLEAYRASFSNRSDVLVLEPNSEFFKYLKSPGKGSSSAPAGK